VFEGLWQPRPLLNRVHGKIDGGDSRISETSVEESTYVRIAPSASNCSFFCVSTGWGGVSAAAISTYTYHPQSERSFGNVMSVWGTQMAWDAVTYMIKEFWPDLRKKRESSH
jgi:hypothetical protein